ncbi:SH3 domain-containing protein [Treponema bryantii]|uniref:SH3 domain-containing protein n=1 Tax=Treponema bryantii TaxID=163 RepID=UPI0003B35C9C|nr:SH3 domain-containing protein [Treponema bryantii]
MEKQRNQRLIKSVRRFLITLFILFCTTAAFAQTLTLEQIRQLRFVPEEGQNLFSKTDLKFTVTIPNVRASQVQVLAATQEQDITFRTIRKTEDYKQNGTTIEVWYNFAKEGHYTPSPLPVMIQNRRRTISFEPVTVTPDPSTMNPRIVVEFEDGTKIYSDDLYNTNPVLQIPTGKKIRLTVNLQYATQLTQFSWDLPKNSIFTCIDEYEFTEARIRERVYSHTLIPVASFEWTGLIAGTQKIPTFRLFAVGYKGSRIELRMPGFLIEFTESDESLESENEDDIFSAAFFQEEDEKKNPEVTPLTKAECQTLADYYTREHNEFLLYPKARQNRINYEESCGLVVSHNPIFPSVLLYIAIIIIITSIVFMIIAIKNKHKIRTLMFIVLLVIGIAVMIYCAARKNERYGICKGCKIYSIPQLNAESISEISAGSRVRILESTGKWYYIEVGETGGWCNTDDICVIR